MIPEFLADKFQLCGLDVWLHILIREHLIFKNHHEHKTDSHLSVVLSIALLKNLVLAPGEIYITSVACVPLT